MELSKEKLIFYRDLVKKDKNNYDVAKNICREIGIELDKDDFIDMDIISRESEYSDNLIPGIVINTNKWELELTILEDRYFITRSWADVEYQFVKQFLYEDNCLLEQSFSLDIDDSTFIALNESFSYNALCVDGEDKSLVRIHQMLVFPDEMDESFDGKVKSFINEVTTTEKVYYNELVYFETDEDMYDITINKNNEVGFFAGTTLGSPEIFLEKTKYIEDNFLYSEIGIDVDDDSEELKRPIMYCYGYYPSGDGLFEYSVRVKKNNDILEIDIRDNREERHQEIVDRDCGPISEQDIDMLIDYLEVFLDDKDYKESIINYFFDIRNKLEYRQSMDLDDIDCYYHDRFDQIINEGKFNKQYKRNKTLEQRGFELYSDKDNLKNLLAEIDSPYLDDNGNSLRL